MNDTAIATEMISEISIGFGEAKGPDHIQRLLPVNKALIMKQYNWKRPVKPPAFPILCAAPGEEADNSESSIGDGEELDLIECLTEK